MKKRRICLLFFITLFMGCREAYDPTLEKGVVSYLVVEGMINAKGITTIEITRTNRLSEKDSKKAEAKATVEIEGDNNTKFALTEQANGVYTSVSNTLAQDRKYRLRIKTSAGKEYLSDFATVKITQPVTVSWSQDADGVDVQANSKDPSKSSLYYHWLTEETWEINSPLRSLYIVQSRVPNVIVRRRTALEIENARYCWTTVRSGNILTANTTRQSEDVISGFSLVKIPNGSDKLDVRYSILVSQYVISKEAYDFFEVMKKNTEKMGSVFDPQPSLVRGNIKCITDPEEMVIGFIDCSVASSRRIFITSKEAGNWKSSLVCQESYVANTPPSLKRDLNTDEVLITIGIISGIPDIFGQDPTLIDGFNFANAACVDCKLRGNNIRPSFW